MAQTTDNTQPRGEEPSPTEQKDEQAMSTEVKPENVENESNDDLRLPDGTVIKNFGKLYEEAFEKGYNSCSWKDNPYEGTPADEAMRLLDERWALQDAEAEEPGKAAELDEAEPRVKG